MKTLAVDSNNDIYLAQNGHVAIATDVLAVEQASVQYVRSRRGEMIHNMDQGIPFEPVAWAGSPNETQFEAVTRARLSQLPENIAVTSFEVRQVGNNMSYTATIETTSGEVIING